MPTLRKNTHSSGPTSISAANKASRARDLIWGRPVFKAPVLQNPRIIFDPLPFTANRITHLNPEPAAE